MCIRDRSSTGPYVGGGHTPGQGNPGGADPSTTQAPFPSAGGGGAGSAGGNTVPVATNGAGGAGLNMSSTFGTLYGQSGWFAGGGAGTSHISTNNAAAGGQGGGGSNPGGSGVSGGSGLPNTGGGGAAGMNEGASVSGSGGSGIVIVRYRRSDAVQATSSWGSDTLATNLRIALPLNNNLGISDYSASISGIGNNRTVTPINGGALSTSQSKYYTSSYDNGTEAQDKYLSIPNSSDLTLGTSNFCIEGWWYFTNNTTGYQVLASHSGDTADQQNGWVLLTETNNTLYFYATDSASGWDVALGGAQVPSTNGWHHIAVTRSGNVFRLFYNGTQVNTQTVSVNIALPNSREFRLGSYRYIPGYPQSCLLYTSDAADE